MNLEMVTRFTLEYFFANFSINLTLPRNRIVHYENYHLRHATKYFVHL